MTKLANDPQDKPRRLRSAPIDPKTQARLAELIATIGEKELCRRLNMAANTLARIVAGMAITRGTRALLEDALASLDKASTRSRQGRGK